MFYIVSHQHTLTHIRSYFWKIDKEGDHEKMMVIHFFENKTEVLNQFVVKIPTVDEDIRIKGRKAKVVQVSQVDENNYHVHVIYEKIVKKQPLTKEFGKKKR